MKPIASIMIVAAVAWLCMPAATVRAQASVPKKLAFLVGVSDYKRDGLANLNYSDDDIEEFAKALTSIGFEVEVVLRERATLVETKHGLSRS